MTILKLTLVGTMQSYGVKGRWDYRDTLAFPTKSAVAGMLGSALGIPRERLEEISSKIKVHVRINRSGRVLEDYQTRGYRETLGSGEKNFVLHKQYLHDASFTVYVEGEADFLESCYKAMRHPVWPVFLGRKCCVPSMPLVGSRDKSVYDVDNLEAFIEQDELPDIRPREKVGFVRYFIEDVRGSTLLYTEVSNQGQKFYRQVRLKECFYSVTVGDNEDVSDKD